MKFKKKKNVEVPQIKPRVKFFNSRLAKKIFYSIVSCIFLLGIFGSIRSFTVQPRLNMMDKELKSFKDEVAKKEESTYFDTFSAKQFLDKFVPLFMNVSNVQEELKLRKEGLATYFPTDFKLPEETNVGTRELKDYSIKRITPMENDVLFELSVTYKVSVDEEKEREVDQKKGKKTIKVKEKYTETKVSEDTKILNVLTSNDNSRFTVEVLPYFSQPTSVLGKQRSEISEPDNLDKVKDVADQEAIKKFTNDFYEKYASLSKDDLAYMMSKPQSLDGQFKYVQTMSENVYVIKGDSYLVISDVEFQDKKTAFKHVEKIYLNIVKKDGKFIVETMAHNLEGVM